MNMNEKFFELSNEIRRGLGKQNQNLWHRMFQEFLKLEDGCSSYAWLENTRFAQVYAVVLVSFKYLFKNMFDRKVIEPEKLKCGTPLVKISEKNGKYIFVGPNVHKKSWIAKNEDLNLVDEVTDLCFKKDFLTTESFSDDNRKFIADFLKIENFKKSNFHRIIFLIDNKEQFFNQIINFPIKLNGQIQKFKNIFDYEYMSNTDLNDSDVRSTNHILTFTVNPDIVSEKILKGENIEAIFLVGNHWKTRNKEEVTKSLIKLANKRKIRICVISSYSVFLGRAMTQLKSFQPIYVKFGTVRKNNKRCVPLELHQVVLNEAARDAYIIIQNILDNFRNDVNARMIFNYLYKWLRIYFSCLDKKSIKLNQINERIIRQVQNTNAFDEQIKNKLIASIKCLLSDNYNVQLENKIRQLSFHQKTLLVTNMALVNETRKIFYLQKQRNIDVINYDENDLKYFYSYYDEIILLTPNLYERRKWEISGINGRLVILVPDISNLNESLFIDYQAFKRLFSKDEESFYTTSDLNVIFQSFIKKHKAVMTTTDRQNSLHHNILDDDNFDESSESEDSEENRSLPNNEKADESKDVKAVCRICFLENKKLTVFGTERGTLLVKAKTGLKVCPISDLKVNDIVAFIDREETAKIYRENFKEISSNSEKRKAYFFKSRYREMDFAWKNEFMNYVNRYRFSPQNLKIKFLNEHYNKSAAFFKSWSSIDHLNFVPDDVEFIKIIGKMTHNGDIEKSPEAYREASLRVREEVQENKKKQLKKIQSKDIKVDYITIKSIEKINRTVKRTKVNYVIRG